MDKSPDAFRTISEVADWLGIQAHVLRFWESKFTQVKPVKRAGGRRYYRPADMQLLGGIKKLLHDDGLTIKGVQKILREQGIGHVSSLSPALDEMLVVSPETGAETPDSKVVPFQTKLAEAEAEDAELASDTNGQIDMDMELPKLAKPKPAPEPEETPELADEVVAHTDNSDAAQDQAPEQDEPADAEPAAVKPAFEKPVLPSFLHRSAEAKPTEAKPAEMAPPNQRPPNLPSPIRNPWPRPWRVRSTLRIRLQMTRFRPPPACCHYWHGWTGLAPVTHRKSLRLPRNCRPGSTARTLPEPHRDFPVIPPCPRLENGYVGPIVGLWRSLVARPSGGRKVAGSSPASPTNSHRRCTSGCGSGRQRECVF